MSEILLPLSVICTSVAFGLGVGPIPLTLFGEILPVRIKSVATAILMALW